MQDTAPPLVSERTAKLLKQSAALDFVLSELKPESSGRLLVPDLIAAQGGALMSLGTPRLCNDPESPRPGVAMPVARIEWNRITIYRQPSARPRDPDLQKKQAENLTRGTFNGYMSPATKRKFKGHVSTWLRSIMLYRRHVKRRWDPGRAYPTMVTLTLPVAQVHTDAEINRACLQPWLQIMKREYGIELYAWRAEAQENGNLHYHVIIDRYVPRRAITQSWNMAIDALEYRARYFEETGSLEPPSTEIHALKEKVQDKKTGEWKTVDPVDYLLDYFTDIPEQEDRSPDEDPENPPPRKLIGYYRNEKGVRCTYTTRPISGRVWGMADALREISPPTCFVNMEMLTALERATDQGDLRRFDQEHASVYFGKIALTLGRWDPGMWAVVQDYYIQIFGWLYPKQLPEEYLRSHPPSDPRGLWVDLSNYGFWYPPTLAERKDEWIAQNAETPGVQIDLRTNPAYLRAIPELRYKADRINRKAERLGIKDLHQRWVFRGPLSGSSSLS